MMLDVLPSVAHLTLMFQKQDIDIAAVHPALSGLEEKTKLTKLDEAHFQRDILAKLLLDLNTAFGQQHYADNAQPSAGHAQL